MTFQYSLFLNNMNYIANEKEFKFIWEILNNMARIYFL